MSAENHREEQTFTGQVLRGLIEQLEQYGPTAPDSQAAVAT